MLIRRTSTLLLLSVAFGVAGCNSDTRSEVSIDEAVPALFLDVTRTSGIDHTYRNREEANHLAILESLGDRVALFDFDGDSLLDVFVTGESLHGPQAMGTRRERVPCSPATQSSQLGRSKRPYSLSDTTGQA